LKEEEEGRGGEVKEEDSQGKKEEDHMDHVLCLTNKTSTLLFWGYELL
jgi:hypothetical protein